MQRVRLCVMITLTVWGPGKPGPQTVDRRTKNNEASSSKNTPCRGMQSLGLHLKKQLLNLSKKALSRENTRTCTSVCAETHDVALHNAHRGTLFIPTPSWWRVWECVCVCVCRHDTVRHLIRHASERLSHYGHPGKQHVAPTIRNKTTTHGDGW